MKRIGIISDTHGLLRPEATEYLQDCDMIVHAGDVGSVEIIEQLQSIAPLVVVRGNVDNGLNKLSLYEMFEFFGKTLYVYHGHKELDIDPAAAGVDVIISGHSHVPLITYKKSILYINPGSAGPKRFSLAVSIASLVISDSGMDATIRFLA